MWLAELDKVRPVVVLTRDPLGHYLNAVIAALVTSTVRNVSTEVPVGPDDGVKLQAVANLDHVQLVARDRLRRRVGRVRASTLKQICDALAIAVGCDGQ